MVEVETRRRMCRLSDIDGHSIAKRMEKLMQVILIKKSIKTNEDEVRHKNNCY